MSGYLCATCGEQHDELPMCFGPSAPDLWYSIPEAERGERGELSTDQCVIDGKHFFVLGRILIPVTDGPGPFIWLAWVSLSEENFIRTCELWESEGRETEPPYFGWLQNALPYEPTTLSLKTKLQTMPLGERPCIVLEKTSHPLSVEQGEKQGTDHVLTSASIGEKQGTDHVLTSASIVRTSAPSPAS